MAVLFLKDCDPYHNISDSDEIWAPSREIMARRTIKRTVIPMSAWRECKMRSRVVRLGHLGLKYDLIHQLFAIVLFEFTPYEGFSIHRSTLQIPSHLSFSSAENGEMDLISGAQPKPHVFTGLWSPGQHSPRGVE